MDTQKKKGWCLNISVSTIAIIAIFYMIGHNNQQEKESANPVLKCLSSWDGSNSSLVKATKAQMNDPSSFEHVETRYVSRGNETDLIMKFRGKNAFGGTVTQTVTGTIDNDCNLKRGPNGL